MLGKLLEKLFKIMFEIVFKNYWRKREGKRNENTKLGIGVRKQN